MAVWTTFWQVFFLLGSVLFAFGCGEIQQRSIIVTVSPQSAVIEAGQVAHFTANVAGDTSGVIWSVNRIVGGNSNVGTIDQTGDYDAPIITQDTTVTVGATSRKDASKSASASISVIAP